MAATFGEKKFFLKITEYIAYVPYGWKISTERQEIEANLCFSIFDKNSKIQNGRHIWGEEFFFKNANSTFLMYPVGRNFWQNIENSKWLPYLGEDFFFNWQ